MESILKFGYEKYNTEAIANTDKIRICAYFVVSDFQKDFAVSVRLGTEELLDEIEKHEDWILESVIWDANHKVDTNREGLSIILEKAKNNEFDILLMPHCMVISRSGSKNFDYTVQLYKLDKSIYGITDGIRSFDALVENIHLTPARQKQYDELKNQSKNNFIVIEHE